MVYDFFSDLAALNFELYCYNNYTFTHFSGIMITSDETEETLTKGFEMLKRTIPNDAFLNTIDGLLIFITDNCDELRRSIKKVRPKATFLLCNFHILQQVWRWLYGKEQGISKDDKVVIMKLFRAVLYANDFESYEKVYKDLADSLSTTQKYNNCLKYFEELFDISQC